MKENVKNILLVLLAMVIVAGATFGAIQWNKTVSKWEKDAEREVFKETVTYSEAAASFLADCYKQYNDAKTDAERNAIMEYVVMRYPNLNTRTIDNDTLRRFYNQCLGY